MEEEEEHWDADVAGYLVALERPHLLPADVALPAVEGQAVGPDFVPKSS